MSVIAKTGAALVAAVALTACVSNGRTGGDDADAEDAPTFTVTVPAERLTPFCTVMNTLSEELLSGEVVDATALIVETYRSLVDDVPPVIASDFAAVLAALEEGAPPPTDPTIVTTTTLTTTTLTTTPSTSDPVTSDPVTGAPETSAPVVLVPVTDASGSTIPSDGDGFFEEGYGPASSPAERVNEYVAFACRDTENNPGPPATPPGGEPADTVEVDS
jgi:hypothetical protein